MSVDGTYKVKVSSPIGEQEGKLVLKSEGNKITGTIEAPMGKADFSGNVNGNDVAWIMEISSPVGKAKLEFKGKVNGQDISGTVKTGIFGDFPFNGKKV